MLKALGCVGLFLIIITGVMFGSEFNFPGWVALIPATGAVALILSSGEGPVGKLFSSRPLVFLGGMSFTIYLIHWPILVFFQNYQNDTKVSLPNGLLIIGSSIILSMLLKKWVENPAGKYMRVSHIRTALCAVVFAFPVIVLGGLAREAILKAAGYAKEIHKAQQTKEKMREEISVIQNAPADFDFIDMLTIPGNGPDLTDGIKVKCDVGPKSSEIITCMFGDLESDSIIAIVGGSHVRQWQPAFDEIGKINNIKIVSLTRSACPFGYIEALNDQSCKMWNLKAAEFLINLAPSAIIVNSTRGNRLSEVNQPEYLPESYKSQWLNVIHHKIPVIGLRDTPYFKTDPNHCLQRNKFSPADCAIPRDNVYLANDPSRLFDIETDQFYSIDISGILCSGSHCPVFHDGIIVYRDSHHITATYSRYASNLLEAKLRERAPWIFKE